ncbi:MAG: citryl-CoA lyase [Bacillota bacterium]|nr:citryl-CoA lyase [Bacillota bacterium]
MSNDGEWKSAITYYEPNKLVVRGYRLDELIGRLSFADGVFLILRGRLPSPAESDLMNAMLLAEIDHGLLAPSAQAARIAISGARESVQGAVAAGVLTLGNIHGGAIEDAAEVFQEGVARARAEERTLAETARRIVHEHQEAGRRIPGFGHPIHTDDPRTKRLFQLAEQHRFGADHVALAREMEQAIPEILGKALPINVDGAVAAIISDMGFDWRLGRGLFIIGRVPGLVAHVYEELTEERPMRTARLVTRYVGPPEQPLPAELGERGGK